MSKHIRWLYEQLDRWTGGGLISAEQAERIRQLYPPPRAALPWGTILFSSLGAVVIGLGVILLGAYNWQAIPKLGKLAIILGAVAGTHAAGLSLLSRPDWRRHVGEGLCVLGTMFFGAGIWLVAQVYHIDEHFPNGFLIWALGALAMAWALPSLAQGLLAAVLLTIWTCTEEWGFDTGVYWSPVLIFLGTGGLAWRLRSSLLWLVATLGTWLAILANTSTVSESLAAPVCLHVSVALVAAGILLRRQPRLPRGGLIWIVLGWAGSLVIVYLLGFPSIVDDLLRWHRWHGEMYQPLEFLVYRWGPFVLALVAWGAVAVRALVAAPAERRIENYPPEIWLLPLSAGLAQMLAVLDLAGAGWGSAGLFGLVFLAVAVMWMARGCREGALPQMLIGSLMLVALTLARYFDLFDSLAARGLAFIVVGGMLFAEGFFYRRTRRATKETLP